MGTQKPNKVVLTERDKYHENLMVNILKNLSSTPLVLKGGTALYLGYGSNRFSEDLDFDSSKKLNLLNKIKASSTQNVVIGDINMKKCTDTVSRYMVNYHVCDTDIRDKLKIEVSYRTPTPDKQIMIKDGIRFSSIDCIIDSKLKAAYDGNNIRTKGRDLFDLHFLATNYAEYFTIALSQRLQIFSQNPDKLVSLYREDIEADPLLNKMDIEQISLELHEIASRIYYFNKKMETNQGIHAMNKSHMSNYELETAAQNKDNQKQQIKRIPKNKPKRRS